MLMALVLQLTQTGKALRCSHPSVRLLVLTFTSLTCCPYRSSRYQQDFTVTTLTKFAGLWVTLIMAHLVMCTNNKAVICGSLQLACTRLFCLSAIQLAVSGAVACKQQIHDTMLGHVLDISCIVCYAWLFKLLCVNAGIWSNTTASYAHETR